MRNSLAIAAALMSVMTTGVYADSAAPPASPPAQISVPPMIPAPMPSPSPTPGAGYTIRYKFFPGEVFKYDFNVAVSGSIVLGQHTKPLSATASGKFDEVVKSVDASGDGTLDCSPEGFSLTAMVDGKTLPIPMNQIKTAPMGKSTVTLSPTGRVISYNAAPTDHKPFPPVLKMFGNDDMGNLSSLPDGPVNIGDVWRRSLSLAMFGVVIDSKMTLVDVSTDNNGDPVARIVQAFYISFNPSFLTQGRIDIGGQVNGSGVALFDLAAGRMLSTAFAIGIHGHVKPLRQHAGMHKLEMVSLVLSVSGSMSAEPGSPSVSAPAVSPSPAPSPGGAP